MFRRRPKPATVSQSNPAPSNGVIGRNWGVLRRRRDIGADEFLVLPRPLLVEDAVDLDQVIPAFQRPLSPELIYPAALERCDLRYGKDDTDAVTTVDGPDGPVAGSQWLQALQHGFAHGCEAELIDTRALLTAIDSEIVTTDRRLAATPEAIARTQQRVEEVAAETVTAQARSDAEARDAEHIRVARREAEHRHRAQAAADAAVAAAAEQRTLTARIDDLLLRRVHVWQVLLDRVSFRYEFYCMRAHIYLRGANAAALHASSVLTEPVWAAPEHIPAPPPLAVRPTITT